MNIFSPYAIFLVLPLCGHVPEQGGGVASLVLEVPVHTGGRKTQKMMWVSLLIDSHISGQHFVHTNAGAERRCGVQLPRVPYGWTLQSDLTLPCDLEWSLAGRWKWCPSDALMPLNFFLAFFPSPEVHRHQQTFFKTFLPLANFIIVFSHMQFHFPTPWKKIKASINLPKFLVTWRMRSAPVACTAGRGIPPWRPRGRRVRRSRGNDDTRGGKRIKLWTELEGDSSQ